MNSANLVIVPVGDGSLHPGWLDDRANKDFDLFLIYYGDTAEQWIGDADYYVARKGSKWELLTAINESHADVIANYERIWLPDDDIRTNTANINRMFELFRERRLELAQPALDRESFVNVPLTRKMPLCRLRYTRCIEIMVPLFSQAAYQKCKYTFSYTKTAWGIDWLWIQEVTGDVARESDRVAILDEVAVTHTRKQNLGAGFYAKLGIDPMVEMEEMLARHGLAEAPKDVRSFFSHRFEVKLFGASFSLPGFRGLRYWIWSAYNAASNRAPAVRRLGRRAQELVFGREGDPTIL